MPKKMSHKEAKQKIFEVGFILLNEYKNKRTKVHVKCIDCGEEIYTNPSPLWRGIKKCSICQQSIKTKTNKENILKISKGKIELCSNFTRTDEKHTFKCTKCGYVWESCYMDVLTGVKKNCWGCNNRTLWCDKTFIEEANKIHNCKYSYDNMKYTNMRNKIQITCPIHGDFLQQPYSHIHKKHGCPDCGVCKPWSNEKFIIESRRLHGDKYVYDKLNYVNSKTSITLICKKHGEFITTPNPHLQGKGCPICKSSNGEDKIRCFLESYNLKFEEQKTFVDCNSSRGVKLKFDFYVNGQLIEYQGEQHYKPIKWFGGEEKFKIQQENDNIKKQFCINNGIPLIEIKFSDKNWEEVLIKALNL